MSTIQHNFDKSWTTVAACRPYRYVTYVSHVSHVSHVTPRFIWGHENRTPSSTAYYHGGICSLAFILSSYDTLTGWIMVESSENWLYWIFLSVDYPWRCISYAKLSLQTFSLISCPYFHIHGTVHMLLVLLFIAIHNSRKLFFQLNIFDKYVHGDT